MTITARLKMPGSQKEEEKKSVLKPLYSFKRGEKITSLQIDPKSIELLQKGGTNKFLPQVKSLEKTLRFFTNFEGDIPDVEKILTEIEAVAKEVGKECIQRKRLLELIEEGKKIFQSKNLSPLGDIVKEIHKIVSSQNSQRYAVVGWITPDGRFNLRFRPGFESSANDEMMMEAKEKFGNNVVKAKSRKLTGIVHEAVVAQVSSDEKDELSDEKFRSCDMIGISVTKTIDEKGAIQLKWTPRSMQNFPTLERDPLALAVFAFAEIDVTKPKPEEAPYFDTHVHLVRSMGLDYFVPIISTATQMLDPVFKTSVKTQYANDSSISEKIEIKWSFFRESHEAKQLIAENLMENVYIYLAGYSSVRDKTIALPILMRGFEEAKKIGISLILTIAVLDLLKDLA
jgi:hypothetical protein